MSVEILDKYQQLKEMAEFKALEKIRNFRTSLEIFDGNYTELLAALNTHNSSIQLIDQRNREVLHKFQREITRLLHNYLASSLSLIDHTRVLKNSLYVINGKFPDYQTEIDSRFKTNPLASYFKDLRRYFQHYKMPGLTTGVNWDGATGITRITISLSLEEMNAFSDWSAPAKVFLQEQASSEIDLLSILQEYHERIISFHSWFTERQAEIHKEDIFKVEKIKKELRILELSNLLDLVGFQVNGFQQFEDVLFQLFRDGELDKIYSSSGPKERLEEVLKLLESRIGLDEKNVKKIKELYGGFNR